MLTIYIPTYNRFKHLQLLLNSLFEDLDENPSVAAKVVVKVFNNNSSDETEKYLKSLKIMSNFNELDSLEPEKIKNSDDKLSNNSLEQLEDIN